MFEKGLRNLHHPKEILVPSFLQTKIGLWRSAGVPSNKQNISHITWIWRSFLSTHTHTIHNTNLILNFDRNI